MATDLKIEPIKLKKYDCKQPEHDILPRVPFRFTMIAPTYSDKTVLISNVIMKLYKNVFDMIYIFSASIDIDDVWTPVKKYITDHCKPRDSERLFFDSGDVDSLKVIMEKQFEVIAHQKSKKEKRLFNILIVLDDLADDVHFCRNNEILTSLYIRGRHANISLISSAQYYLSLNPTCRKQISDLFLFKLRNKKDLDAILDEFSALIPKDELLQAYNFCVGEPYCFMWINLRSKDHNKMICKNFDEFIFFE
jgi:hypothetical protein